MIELEMGWLPEAANLGVRRSNLHVNYFKKYERAGFVILFFVTVICGIVGVYAVMTSSYRSSRWVATTGLLATATGVVQLDVSGFFERILDVFGDEQKYPYGPPSYITREIIANPDTPVRTWLSSTCFFNARTGFWFILIGTLMQVAAVWL
jgi:hypothetical protein